jgi:gliding motility-associated peptidyl-prolyl isomerase
MKYSLIIILVFVFVSCSGPKPRKPISKSNNSFIKKSIERNKLINKIEEDFFKNKMQQDTINKYYNSNNGFWYYYNKKSSNNTAFPKKGDEVVINYSIKDVYNKLIYNMEELGSKDQPIIGDRTYKIDAEDFITGIQEGIKFMKVEEQVTFLFPSNKVFGATGFRDRIKPNQPLIITVFLKQIN